MKNWVAKDILKRPFHDLPALCMNIKNKQELRSELESLAKRAAMMAAYIDYREGFGGGDQGHAKAIKNMNKVGKAVWMKAFGYNAYPDLSF
jgi:hypothetical protein